jgi:hypothetical protein
MRWCNLNMAPKKTWERLTRSMAKEGLSWYLTDIKGTKKQVMETYGLRWRIEEYHRQIKQDFQLNYASVCFKKWGMASISLAFFREIFYITSTVYS